MNFRPLCTASVCPTISGTIVDRRDHVLITFFSAPRFITSIFSSSEVSTNRPFLSDLPIACLPHPSLRPPRDDEPIRALAVPRLVPLGRQPPRRHRMPAARGLPLAAAERMIDRVHRHAAHVRPPADPAAPPRLPDRHVLMLEVAHLPDRGVALHQDAPDLARGHLHRRVVA